jgi:hypothetical protein
VDPNTDGWFPPGPRHHSDRAVLNESWPPLDVARRLKDVPRDRQIEVEARLVLPYGGEEWVRARAVRWTRTHVCVWVPDARLLIPYVWLVPSDVRRVPVDNEPPAAPDRGTL